MSLQTKDERAPAVAGQFYPADPKTLRRDVTRYLAAAKPKALSGDLVALLVPHAGYVYSAGVAAEAFAQIKPTWETVVLLGPAHRVAVKGAGLWAKGSFSTPLGPVPIDETLAAEILAASPLFEEARRPHQDEHSLEVQLPFLQEKLPECRIVPMVLNAENLDSCRRIGRELGKVLKGKAVLIVISSDLSHYPAQETARRADKTCLLALQTMDSEFIKLTSEMLLDRGETELHCAFCGEAALLAGLEAAKNLGADRAEILRYANSADVPQGDPDRVVGYAAVAFVRTPAPSPLPGERAGTALGEGKHPIGPEAAKVLLKEARASIQGALDKKSLVQMPLSEHPELNLPLNVFVTLWLDGNLQGCIGSLKPRETLLEAVRRLARESAFEDPRGKTLSRTDLSRLKIEISILSPTERVAGPQAIRQGDHGVILRKGLRTGLYLPDVWEHYPSKEDFLDGLCEQKLGLPARSWKEPDMLFEVFTTQKIKK